MPMLSTFHNLEVGVAVGYRHYFKSVRHYIEYYYSLSHAVIRPRSKAQYLDVDLKNNTHFLSFLMHNFNT